MAMTCLRCNQAPRQIGSSFCDGCKEAIPSGRPLAPVPKVRVAYEPVPAPEPPPKPKGRIGRPPKPKATPAAKLPRGCDVPGCPKPHSAKGLCARHYSQKQRGTVPFLERGCFFCMPGTGGRPLCGPCKTELDGLRAYLRTRCSTLVPL